MFDSIGPRILYGIGGLALGAVLALWFQPQPEVVTQTVVETRTETKEVVRWKEKVKWKTKTVYREDGSVASIETCGLSSSTHSSESSTKSSRTSESLRVTSSLSRYTIGLSGSWEAVTNPADLSLYRLEGGIRLGDWPIVLTGSVNTDLDLMVGIRYEF